jgi:hypothetical protein
MSNGSDDQRLAEIVRWFREHDIDLALDRFGDQWAAVMLPANTRIGAADYALGPTKVEAAEAARAKFEQQDPEAFETASDEVATRIASGAAKVIRLEDDGLTPGAMDSLEVKAGADSDMGADSAELVRQLEQVLTDYDWKIGFMDEPDGGVTGYLMDAKTSEVLKTARGRDFPDAYLGLGIDTYPPSEEVRREQKR